MTAAEGRKTDNDETGVVAGITVTAVVAMATVLRRPGLSETIALPFGLQAPGLPLGVKVPSTLTTSDEILPHLSTVNLMTSSLGQFRRHYPPEASPGGQRRLPKTGVNKKTCIEGMAGSREVATILNGAGNSVLTALSASGRSPLMPPLESCHQSTTQAREASTNDVALLPSPRQRTAKRNASVVREKNASGRRKASGESGTIGGRKHTRVTKHASVIATAKQNRAGRRTAILVKREQDRAAHVMNNPATKTSGWRSLRLRVHLSPLYPILPPL